MPAETFLLNQQTYTLDIVLEEIQIAVLFIHLNNSAKASVNKQPKVIFEKPEKQQKSKVYLNEFVQNLTSTKDKAMKFNVHSNSRLKTRKKTLCRHWRILPKQREQT